MLAVRNESGGSPAANVEVRVFLRASDDQPGGGDDLLLLTRSTGPVTSTVAEVHDFGTILIGNPLTFPGDYLVVTGNHAQIEKARAVLEGETPEEPAPSSTSTGRRGGADRPREP